MKKKTAALLCTVLILLMLTVTAFADFGDYAGDYDYGGYDSYDYNYDYDYDYDYDDNNSYGNGVFYYGGYDSGTHGDGDSDTGSTLLGAVVLIIIIAVILYSRKKKNKNSASFRSTASPRPQGAAPTPASGLKPVSGYTAVDRNFSEAELCEKLSNLYVRFQNAWQKKNLEELRPYISDSFYASADRQLDAYRKNRQTNMIERIAVLGVSLSGWTQRNGEDIMIARLRTRITDYVVDDGTGEVVRGSRTAEKFMEYEWTLSRKTGTVSGQQEGLTVQTCPNCGAPLNINRTAKCEYCGGIITVDGSDWVVTGIKGLSQNTQGK